MPSNSAQTLPADHATDSRDDEADAPYIHMAGAMLGSSPDLVLVVNRAGKLIYIGDSALRALGTPRDRLLGKRLEDLFAVSDLFRWLDGQREQVLSTREPWSSALSVLCGEEICELDVTLTSISDEDSTSGALLCIAREVAERRRSREAQRYIMAGARCLLWYSDVYDVGRERLKWLMEVPDLVAAHRFLPLDIGEGEDYVGAWYRSRLEEDKDRTDQYGHKNVRAGLSYQQEFRCRSRHGDVMWLHEDVQVDSVVPGSHWKLVGVCVDITVQKQREQEIRWLNDRLRVSVQETHHRVKNNLQLIAAMLDMAASEHTDSLPMSEVKRIMQQVLTLASLHDMLTGSVIATYDARGLVSMKAALGRLLSLLAETGRFTIDIEIEDVVLPLSATTSVALILNELVTNAVKHGGRGVRVALRLDNGTITVEVEDDGPGFAADFDVVAASHTGLTLVEYLVRHDLAGSLTFANRDEGGARVRFRFAGISQE